MALPLSGFKVLWDDQILLDGPDQEPSSVGNLRPPAAILCNEVLRVFDLVKDWLMVRNVKRKLSCLPFSYTTLYQFVNPRRKCGFKSCSSLRVDDFAESRQCQQAFAWRQYKLEFASPDGACELPIREITNGDEFIQRRADHRSRF